MRIQCGGCNKTLNVPDQFAGKKVKCPVCDRTIIVPEGEGGPPPAESPDLEIKDTWDGEGRLEAETEAKEETKPTLKRRRLHKISSRRRSEARKELAEIQQHRGRSAPPPMEAGSAEYCPSCNAPLIGGAVVCTFCGFDLRVGKRVLGPRDPIWPRIRGLIGPLAGLVVVLVGGYYIYDKWLATKPPEKQKKPEPPAVVAATQSTTPAGVVKPPASTFKGGPIPRETYLEDVSSPYKLEEDIRISTGSALHIKAGVSIEGSGGIVGPGRLVLAGSTDKRIRLSVPIRLDKEAAARPSVKAEGTLFLAPVKIRGPEKVQVDNCTLQAGLTLDLEALQSSRVEVEITRTRIAGADPVLALNVPGHTKQMLVKINDCDIMGNISGTIGSFSSLDLTRNYWSLNDTEALGGLRGEGDVVTKPVMAEPVVGETLDNTPAEAAMRIEKPSISLPIPDGWRPGEKHSVWRETPRGSIVVSLIEERAPTNGLPVYLDLEVKRLYSVDRDASGKAAEKPLVDASGYDDHVVDLYWHEAPYRIIYHVTEIEGKILGAKASLPASLWDENREELARLLAALERKGE